MQIFWEDWGSNCRPSGWRTTFSHSHRRGRVSADPMRTDQRIEFTHCVERVVFNVSLCLCADATLGVFHLRSDRGQYKLNFSFAQQACGAEGGALATYTQLNYAQEVSEHVTHTLVHVFHHVCHHVVKLACLHRVGSTCVLPAGWTRPGWRIRPPTPTPTAASDTSALWTTESART